MIKKTWSVRTRWAIIIGIALILMILGNVFPGDGAYLFVIIILCLMIIVPLVIFAITTGNAVKIVKDKKPDESLKDTLGKDVF